MLSANDVYKLEKLNWSHDDFDKMGWHDATIYAISFQPERFEFSLDIDYILAWVAPVPPSVPPSPGYSFWVSPATLVFKNVWDFNANISGPVGLQILNITRENPRAPKNAEFIDLKTEWNWKIELDRGEITFTSAGFSQYLRRSPLHYHSQQVPVEERGGISFATA